MLGGITLWATLVRPVKAILVNVRQHNEALCAILSAEISRIHREYVTLGKIDRLARQLVINLYQRYKDLGGNGYIDVIMEELKKLPVIMPAAGFE